MFHIATFDRKTSIPRPERRRERTCRAAGPKAWRRILGTQPHSRCESKVNSERQALNIIIHWTARCISLLGIAKRITPTLGLRNHTYFGRLAVFVQSSILPFYLGHHATCLHHTCSMCWLLDLVIGIGRWVRWTPSISTGPWSYFPTKVSK